MAEETNKNTQEQAPVRDNAAKSDAKEAKSDAKASKSADKSDAKEAKKSAKAEYKVLSKFQDSDKYAKSPRDRKVYNEGDDISGFPQERLDNLESLGIIEKL